MKHTIPKRPWFQMHLSTCLFATFVSAGFLWVNLGRTHLSMEVARISQASGTVPVAFFERSGWPFTIYEFRDIFVEREDFERHTVSISAQQYRDEYKKMPEMIIGSDDWYIEGILLNLLCCVIIVFGVSALFEWRMRSGNTNTSVSSDN